MRNVAPLYSLFVLVVFLPLNLSAQNPAYKIGFKVNGWADTTVYMGYYYGESTYLKDTAKVDNQGSFVFEGEKALPQGVYFLVMNSTKLFEFLVGGHQQFSLKTDASNFVEAMEVAGDKENGLFFGNMKFIGDRNEKAQPFIQVVNDSTLNDEAKNAAREELKKIGEEVRTYQDKLIAENSSTVVATILKAQKSVEIPDDLAGDEKARFVYYKNHYWDNFDLSNEVLIRLPDAAYRKKMENYLDNLYSQIPDSLIKGVTEVVNQAKASQETYKYAVWNLCLKYQNPKIMGQDEVFIHLYDTYFATGEMDYWANESLKKNLKERADQLRKSLVGQQAPNMILLDDKLQQVSLYGVNHKYTVIYFYDPDCGHCKKETPKLKEFYDNSKHDVEVFAVSADTSMMKMKNYIKDMGLTWISANGPRTVTPHYHTLYDANTTPTIYVLDEKKKIIAKKLEAVRLEEFLDNYEKYN